MMLVSCVSKRSPNNNCAVISASLSVFTDNGGKRAAEAEDDIKDVLLETMDMGVFNYARMGIVRISFRGS